MSNNDLWCLICQSQHPTAEDCVSIRVEDSSYAFVLRDTDQQTIFTAEETPSGTHYLRFFQPDGTEIASIDMHTGAVRTMGPAAGAEAAHIFWEAFGETIARQFKEAQ